MAIIAENVFKTFQNPPTAVLKGVSLRIEDGDFVSIIGKSGSGKTTLLYLLSTLDDPTEGQIQIENQIPQRMEEGHLHHFRNQNIGYVFQFHYLLPELNVLENVLLPARKTHQHEAKTQEAIQLLDTFGLKDKISRMPNQISGGEQQRVAIARALIMKPKYIFADEPTGNLDTVNGLLVMNLLKKINEESRATLILVTHDPDFANMAKRQITLVDGRVS